MSEADFRRELNARFADNDELKFDKTETSTIVDAIVNVLYTIKEDVSYAIK